MATYIDISRVQYLSSSGGKAPLCRLYFCRHCLKLRSSDCVAHEVDSHYCPNCLENMPTPEARLKKNICVSCFDCPSCRHTLSTRASSIAVPSADDPSKTVPKKVYYLACAFCRWTSRDVGIPDQAAASGGWPEQVNPDGKRVAVLLEYYRQLAQREKLEKEKKKYTRRRNYLPLHFSEKYGLTSRRRSLMSMGSLSLKESDDLKIQEVAPGEMLDNFDDCCPLSDDVYTEPLALAKVTTVTQRHANPEFQPESVSNLYPRCKKLLIKRSQRCKECEHNLSKPEFNPASIKFKIQLVAVHHVPEVRIMKAPNLQPQKATQVILSLFNPLDNVSHVTLHPNEEEDNKWDTAKATLPTCELVLSPRDDAAEFDDHNDPEDFKDDPSVVVFRKANKIGFFVTVTPEDNDDDIKISFSMKYDYRNMTTTLQSDGKGPEMVWLKQNVYINFGRINS